VERISITNARANLYALVKKTAKSNQPITIVGKAGNAVLISEDDWNAINETMYLRGIPGLVESIQSAAAAGDDEFVDANEVDW